MDCLVSVVGPRTDQQNYGHSRNGNEKSIIDILPRVLLVLLSAIPDRTSAVFVFVFSQNGNFIQIKS